MRTIDAVSSGVVSGAVSVHVSISRCASHTSTRSNVSGLVHGREGDDVVVGSIRKVEPQSELPFYRNTLRSVAAIIDYGNHGVRVSPAPIGEPNGHTHMPGCSNVECRIIAWHDSDRGGRDTPARKENGQRSPCRNAPLLSVSAVCDDACASIWRIPGLARYRYESSETLELQ